MTQKYKLIKGIDEINWEFEPVLHPPRGGHWGYYERELIKDCDQRFYFFNNRTAQDWNYLTDEIVSASSTNGFKNKMDVYLKNRLQQSLLFAIYWCRTVQEQCFCCDLLLIKCVTSKKDLLFLVDSLYTRGENYMTWSLSLRTLCICIMSSLIRRLFKEVSLRFNIRSEYPSFVEDFWG